MKVFVSYSGQTTASPYFDRFCQLLQEALVRATGDKKSAHVLADTQLGQGDQWTEQLAAKLNQADVLLTLYSPLYFASVPCGRELGFFLARLDGASRPVSIPVLPIWWSARREKDAEGFSTAPVSGEPQVDVLQHRTKDSAAHGRYSFNDIEKMGLDQFLVNEAHVDFKPAVSAYFRMLADRICDLAPAPGILRSNAGAIADSRDVWAGLRNGAIGASVAPPAAPLPAAPIGARVHFLIVAARPEEIEKTLGVTVAPVDAYRAVGGKDWRPFWPADGYVGYWLQRIVQRNFDGCEANVVVESDPSRALALALDIDRQSQPLFFIVDAWTTRIDPHKKLVSELSTRNLPNCAVVVPFVSARANPDVVDHLHVLLQQREELDDALCKTYIAVDERELEAHIATLHERMRQKFRTRAALASKRRSLSPFDGGTKPDLTAVSAEPAQ